MRWILLAALLLPSLAIAEPYNKTNTFTGGTPAVASEVNENFDEIEVAVDDNAADIDALQALDTTGEMQTAEGVNIILETEIDTAAEINALTTDEDFLTDSDASSFETADAAIVKSDETETLSAAWDLGTPSAHVATNSTGTAAGLTAGAATALASDPTACTAGSVVTDVAADGTLTCSAIGSMTSGTPTPTANCTGGADLYMDTDLPGLYACFTDNNWTLVGP